MRVFGDHAQHAGGNGGLAVAARLALHEDELDVVLDDRVRLVGLAQKTGAVLHLIGRVGDLVPDDRGQIVEADLAAALLDRGMERDHGMPALVLAPRQADVAHDANQPPAGDQGVKAAMPDLVKLRQELLIVGHIP